MICHICLKCFVYFFLFIFICFMPAIPQDSTKPVLFGKITLQTSSGIKKPLTRAKIQLLEIRNNQKPGKVLYSTTTTNRGNFNFFNVSKEKYYLKVVKNENTYFQLKNTRRIEVDTVDVFKNSKPLDLQEIIVTQ